MYRILPTLVLLFIITLAGAQPAEPDLPNPTLEGQLVEASSGNPLSFATVMLYDAQDSSMVANALTDDQGNFQLTPPTGEHYLVFQFVGYENRTVTDVVISGQGSEVDLGTVEMRQEAVSLGEVEISAERSQMQLKMDRRVFNVSKDLSNSGANAADILDNVPSVTVDTEGNLRLRGSQGVRILINGKPSGLVSNGDTEALRRMQGDMIARVEVITNPSARYEAEGEAGIINIILKKEDEQGLNGSFGLNVGQPSNYSGSYNLNFRRKNINFFSNFGLNYRRSPGGGFTEQRFFDNSGDLENTYTIDRDQDRGGWGGNLQAGLDWYLSERDLITASVLYRTGRDDNTSLVTYEDFDANDNLLERSVRDNQEDEEEHNIEASLRYEKTFAQKDRKWTTDFKFINDDDTELAEYLETFSNDQDPLMQKSRNTEDERNIILQSDYIHPLGENSKFEAGARAALRTVNNNFQVQERDENGDFFVLPNFDDNLEYEENVYAAYVIGATKLWDMINVQAGLRAEYSDIRASLLKSGQDNEQNYLSLFPSASLSYELTQTTQLQVSYSRRLSRPYFRRLLPFSSLRDRRNISQGNPNLRPEFTDSYEAGILRYLDKGSFLSSVYYRRTTGVITRITIPGENGTSLRFPINLAERDAYGVEFTFSYDWFDWWSINADLNFFRSLLDGSYEGVDYTADAFTWNGRIDSKLSFGKFEIQPSFNYRGPRNTPQGRRLSSYALNIGVSMELFDGRGDLIISGRDLFNTRVRRSIIDLPDFESESSFQWRQTQSVNVSFNYRLQKKEGRRSRR
ncbi:MAG TPA: outer membrane beta-barrel family protein [Saprospiraceae bacterium]|nr:outer membrane beta-barrel family protein [Saprospiraceae bacterium]